MPKEIISTFRESPKTKYGKVAFVLSVISICSGPILGISAALIVPSIAKVVSERVGQVFGFMLMIVMVCVLVTLVFCSLKAYRAGERSWQVMVAVALSALTVLFWVFMLVGELLFPH